MKFLDETVFNHSASFIPARICTDYRSSFQLTLYYQTPLLSLYDKMTACLLLIFAFNVLHLLTFLWQLLLVTLAVQTIDNIPFRNHSTAIPELYPSSVIAVHGHDLIRRPYRYAPLQMWRSSTGHAHPASSGLEEHLLHCPRRECTLIPGQRRILLPTQLQSM